MQGKHELKYAVSRLIRGLGASKDSSKIGFYTVLVALFNSVEDISVSDVFEHVKKELHSSGSNSKSVSNLKYLTFFLLNLIYIYIYRRTQIYMEDKYYFMGRLFVVIYMRKPV